MTKFVRLGTFIIAMSLATVAYGQSDDWHVSGSLVFTNDDPDRRIDDTLGGAEFAVGWDFSDHLTLEGALGYSKIDGFYRQGTTFVRDSETHLDLGANLLAFFDRDRPFAPYVSVGVGYLGVNYGIGGSENRPSASLGLGFKWKPFASRWSLRGEYSSRLAYEDDFNLVDGIFALGAEYDFGGPNLFDGGTSDASSTATPGLYGPWHVSGSVVYFDDDPDRRLDDGISGMQINAGYDWTDHFTVEGHLSYADIDGFYRSSGVWLPNNSIHLDLGVNVLAFLDRDRQFAPYLTAGIGYLGTSVTNNSSDSDENRMAITGGAGFKWRLGQSRFSIRNEYRARLAYEEDNNFIDFIATLGLEYRFGGPRQRDDLPRDSDGDGVLDMWDECPDTPAGVSVTSRGCEIQRMDRDEDNDRVFDDRDQCPGTPEGMPVDPFGCSLDSDRDGVYTDKDRCPGSRPGAVVDEFGCENDSDGDKVPDHLDYCPNTRLGVPVDQRGCEIREVISLPGVNFQSGSDLLLAGAERLIQEVAETIKANDYVQVEVAGHTDDRGSDLDNQGLSDRRAKTVYDYLIRYGVDRSRMTFRGYGESQPIADNTTPDGRATNRRVELRVIKD